MLANDTNIKSDILAVDRSGVEEMDYTFFKSVGTAIQDVMTANMVVRRARELNIGQQVDMS
jgi:ornithine cyclodeaminase/alanine dehydrogenase-like protein (mu-crystallin family)